MVTAKHIPGSISNPCEQNVKTPCGGVGSGQTENPCKHVPKRICVTLTIDQYENDIGCGEYDCQCDSVKKTLTWNCNDESYSGTITCDDLSIDVEFKFERSDFDRDGYEECLIVLFSSCIYGTDANGDPKSEAKESGCKSPSAEWDVDLSSCGDENCGSATISVEKADDLCPPNTGGCLGCQGCGCLCRCLCISYVGPECAGSDIVCWDESKQAWEITIRCSEAPPACDAPPAYQTDVTLTITFEEDGYGNCVLVLESDEGEVVEPEQSPGCPSVNATWTLTFYDDRSDATITAVCGACQSGCGSVCDCFGHELPCSLTATIVAMGGSSDCDCYEGQTSALLANRDVTTNRCGCEYTNDRCAEPPFIDCPTDEDPNNTTQIPELTAEFIGCGGNGPMQLSVTSDVETTFSAPTSWTCDPLFFKYAPGTQESCSFQGSGTYDTIELTP